MDEAAIKGGADRVLYVLATLARLERPVAMPELVELTGLAQSTLYRQLALLKRWGFVIGDNSAYSPGPMCVPLAWGFDQSSFLRREAHDQLDALSRESGESIGLLVAAKDQVVCLDMVESSHSLRCSFQKGRSLPLSRGASAKALLAFMSAAQQAATLQRLYGEAPQDAPARTALAQQLIQIRAQGYAISDGEVDTGIWGVSAPIFQQPGRHATAVITLMAPSTRVRDRTQGFVGLTVQAASHISQRLQSL
ncbi:IclR family transcriptional regulator [Allopusillimonas soli]|uniref:IclR family transcriptional regulator n=1 Tax=Allopusillimonas soli TaxID=659016 RepID=A0A853F7N9_9BURK|nr:IclR family transcriptional regulator [Allopusillimonas soli]NYT35989.1 IclR family transcriptional regulator [Allopusillimonas soli]TEA76333.1 IclR family transcriptional regulator [Allopusillimonas soli]